jgi:SNF2 family DNA or RNA helicase
MNFSEPPSARTPSWPHQREAFWKADARIAERGAAILPLKMGRGKSKVVIDLLNHWQALRVLILCPKSVIPVWGSQLAAHSSRTWMILPRTFNQTSRSFASKVEMNHGSCDPESPLAVICNYDSIWREPLNDLVSSLKWDAIVLDESHRLKAPGGKASRGIRVIARNIPRRLALTGTPAPHSPLDLYAQFRALDTSVFGTSFASFRQRFAIMGGFQGKQVIGFRNQKEMRELYLKLACEVDDSAVVLPEVTHTEIPVILEHATQQAYRSLDHHFVARVKSGEIVASNALTQLLRLQQLTGGSAVTEDESGEPIRTQISHEKQSALADLLEDLDAAEPVVVFCRFHADLTAVHNAALAAKRKSLELSGRANELAEWQRGDAPILAAQIQAGSVGVDMTRAAYVVFYSLGFSLGEYEQALARSHRPGQTRPVSYYHLVCPGTVDTKVYSALQARKDVVSEIIEGIRRET